MTARFWLYIGVYKLIKLPFYWFRVQFLFALNPLLSVSDSPLQFPQMFRPD